MNYKWVLYGFIAILLVQGSIMLIWPNKYIQFQVWEYKRFIGAEVGPGGKIGLLLCRLGGAASIVIGTFVLFKI
jgi:hypothetical protein